MSKTPKTVINVDDDKFMSADLIVTTGLKGLKLTFDAQYRGSVDIHVYDAQELINAIQKVIDNEKIN